MAIIACSNRALPRDLDVSVQVNRPQFEVTTDLSVAVAVVQNPTGFDHGGGRIRYYTSLSAVEDDFATTTEAWKMANAFFAQSPRALRMAIGGAFTTAQAGFLRTGTAGTDAAGFAAVTDGSFTISIDADEQLISSLDFSSATDLDDVAATIQTALRAVASGGYTAATVTQASNVFTITSGTTGDSSTVSVLTAGTSGTDISGSGFLNGLQGSGVAVDGYAPTGIQGELALIEEAARCAGRFTYGWALEAAYRDATEQNNASQWAEGRTALLAVLTNDVNALQSTFTTDIGSVASAAGRVRTTAFYSDQPDEYMDMAFLAYALHVNYAAANSTVTIKFKNLNGITPAAISESQLTILQNKRYNVLTRVGNQSRTLRDGVQASSTWFIDDLINLDNFREELQVAIYNVFLRTNKVPYTVDGVNMLEGAASGICQQYILNGTFASRRVLDSTRESGFRDDPAYSIESTPIQNISAADRANRVGPPMTITANLAGAIHTVAVTVNAFN